MKELFSKEKWGYLFYTLSHPSEGFYWIRHQDRGSVAIAVLLVILYSVCFSLNRIYASFVVNAVNPRSVNAIAELTAVLALYLIACVGNWSVTCLMDGEGRFKDIIIAIGYALLPMILCTIIGTVVSQAVAENEEAFYTIIMGVGAAWSAIMMMIGIMQIHNYTLGKTLVTMFLTVVALLIIIFLAVLISDFISKVYGFLRSLYTELLFR